MKNMCAFEQNELESNDLNRVMGELYAIGVQHVNLCHCGAFTFEFERGEVSVSVENAGKFFLQIPQSHFNTLAKKLVPNYSNCNHCVNHWGLDVCACGSGEPYENCNEGYDNCGTPSQNLEDVL